MRLPYTIDTFTADAWENIFHAFVIANKSHWRGAPYDAVMNILRVKGRFEFTVNTMGTWTCRFVLSIIDDGYLDASFVQNEELSPLMRKQLVRMKDVFERELAKQ